MVPGMLTESNLWLSTSLLSGRNIGIMTWL